MVARVNLIEHLYSRSVTMTIVFSKQYLQGRLVPLGDDVKVSEVPFVMNHTAKML